MAKLKAVGQPPEAFEKLVRKALTYLVQNERASFANDLETARDLWRSHRELVEALEFPEPLRAAFVKENGFGPDQGKEYEDVLAPNLEERLLPQAREWAHAWMLYEQDPTNQRAKADTVKVHRRATPLAVAASGLFLLPHEERVARCESAARSGRPGSPFPPVTVPA